ncbi:coiled-coil domain-containing protein [Brevundimonas goettingensis]|uniref:TipN n=1 Tax=Brevundimonas goettingensis TaxID=2774190 RepID=A0A975C6Q6_9CAUL|nr:tipN [Brevundimonas goettingensis]QTC92985.1 tipN [Brevundimonas goettingensis]
MKSRQRPPLNLPEPAIEDPATTPGEPAIEAEAQADDQTGMQDEALFAEEVPVEAEAPLVIDRPISERRRRRLLEEQRQAELRAAARAETLAARARVAEDSLPPLPDFALPEEAEAPDAVVTPDFAPAPFAESAEAPPATVASPPAPRAETDAETPTTAATMTRLFEAAPSGRYAYLLAGVASALWIGGVASWAAFEVGSGAAALDPLRLALYALIALAPAGLAVMLAHAVRQGAGLAAETRRARGLAEALVAPTALAAQQTGQVLLTLRNDIDQAALAAERARNDMALLREVLVQETNRLNEAAETAGRTARRLSEQLGREREGMQTLGLQLDTQSAGVLDAVERQSRMIVDASDLAQTQLREAEAALAARAADLAAAAGEAQDAARLAADDLARQTLRLENTGAGVAEQIQSVEEGLGQQRAALVTAAYALRTDQEDFSAQVESQRAQLTEQLDAARTAHGDLGETSVKSAESIKDLVEAATDQFRALIDMSQREADGFDAATKVSLDRFEALAAEARDTLVEETRRALAALTATAEDSRIAAADAAAQAQIRADRLGEALFDAAQKADNAADSRIEGARRIVNETAAMVDQAGVNAIEKLERTMDRMIKALGEVDATITDLDERAARLPEEARARAEDVRATVEEGLAALAAASRKAAEDTEALDVGFQERVRRNYDMLTEAVRLMGVVSGEPSSSRRREPAPAPEARPSAADDRGFGLRGRLRLEPTEEATRRQPPPPSQAPALDWADLVNDGASPPPSEPMDLDQPIMPSDADAMSDRITAAIRRMGVDPNALLPRSRVEEAAEAFAGRDPDRARQIVRRVAPAAVRSVSRRVMSDPELKSDAERYVRAYAQKLAGAARSGDAPGVLSSLATDAGRAFMLLDAAVGDLG